MGDLLKKITEGMTWKAYVQIIGLILLVGALQETGEHVASHGNESVPHEAGHFGVNGLGMMLTFAAGKLFGK